MKPQKPIELLMKPTTEDGEPVLHTINIVWKDRLDGEREGAGMALNQDNLDTHEATLVWWAAAVRLGLYSGGFYQFAADLIHAAAVEDGPEKPALDPTQQAAPTSSASPSPSTSPAPPSTGS